MSFNRLFKGMLNSVYSTGILSKYQLKLGYIFHAEQLHNDLYFNQMLAFCKDFKNLTGAKPVATIAPPTNKLLQKQLEDASFNPTDYPKRVRLLAQHAAIGYHGHFYQNNSPEYFNGMHCNQFNGNELKKQLDEDLEWFSANEINHNGVYAGGWWFMNDVLASALISYGFTVDFSFSRSPYFYNAFSCKLMNDNDIRAGESFYLQNELGRLLCIQNYVGTHNTPFRIDIDRPLKKLFDRNKLVQHNLGMLNSHDYDLNATHVLPYINHLLQHAKASFLSLPELKVQGAANATKVIQLGSTD